MQVWVILVVHVDVRPSINHCVLTVISPVASETAG